MFLFISFIKDITKIIIRNKYTLLFSIFIDK